jgi:hypothetical protein
MVLMIPGGRIVGWALLLLLAWAGMRGASGLVPVSHHGQSGTAHSGVSLSGQTLGGRS